MKHCSLTLGFLCVIVVVSAANTLDDDPTKATPGEVTHTPNRNIREEPSAPSWLDEVIVNGCQVDTLPKTSGLQNIATLDKQSFFFRPGPTFRQVTFRMRLDAMLTSGPSFVVDGEMTFTAEELPNAMANTSYSDEEPPWYPVLVEDYRKVRKYGRDRIALRVTLAGISKNLVSDYWWRLNRYEGFELYAEGKSQWAFSCDPRRVREGFVESPARFGAPNSWWWVVGSGLILLVLAFVVMVIVAVRWSCVSQRRHKRRDGTPRSSPPLVSPSSRPQGVVNPFVIDTENIYEEIPLNSPDKPSLPSYSTYLSATRESSKSPKSPHHLAKKKNFYAFMMEKNPWFSGASPEPKTQRSTDNVYELHPVAGSSREVPPGPKGLESPYVDMNQGNHHQQRTWPLPHELGKPLVPDGGHVESLQPDASAHYANLTQSLR